MNTGSALAAILSPIAFGYIIDKTGNRYPSFTRWLLRCSAPCSRRPCTPSERSTGG